jgi:hypothetical protein
MVTWKTATTIHSEGSEITSIREMQWRKNKKIVIITTIESNQMSICVHWSIVLYNQEN